MPTLEEHQRKVERNLRFLETIDTDEFIDWMGVVAFYIAVHLVEQLRAVANQHSADHEDRLSYLRNLHPHIFLTFRSLYSVSLVARYEGGELNWLSPEKVTGWLDVIRDYVREALPS